MPTSRRLLEAGARWLMQHYRGGEGPAFGTYVPNAGDADQHPAVPARPSRLAWCYGDPGVAVALFAVARALDDSSIYAAATAMAERMARIRAEPSVEDASLCHGSAGLLHLFNRLYQATGDSSAREAAVYWAERTLVVRAGPHAIAGPAQDDSPYGHLRFLEGAAGSALALLAAASSNVPLWDGILLLDVPVASRRSAARSRPRSVAASRSMVGEMP
jgi:hypothetical protein